MNAFFVNPLPVAAFFGSSGIAYGALANMTNDYAGIVTALIANFGADGRTAFFNVDLGKDATIDTIMAFGLGNVGTGVPAEVAYATSAQGPFTGAFASFPVASVIAGSELMASGKSVGWLMPPAPITARYLQIAITMPVANTVIDLARLVIGRRFTPERNFAFGGAFGIRDFGSLELSNRAVLLRRRAPKRRTVGISFSTARRDEVEATIMPLVEQLGGTDCVALVTDPAADAMRARRCYFGPLTGELGTIWRNAAAWEWRVNLLSLF